MLVAESNCLHHANICPNYKLIKSLKIQANHIIPTLSILKIPRHFPLFPLTRFA